MCATACPAQCIFLEAAPSEDGRIEKRVLRFDIDHLVCVFCGLCVEACPTEAITESKLFEFSFTNRNDAIYTKNELVVDDDGRAQQLPWELWHGHEDEKSSGWMRATSASGDADYVGEVAWCSERGFGVRSAEPKQASEDS